VRCDALAHWEAFQIAGEEVEGEKEIQEEFTFLKTEKF